MIINIRFDYVQSKWEISISQDGRYIATNGKTLADCFLNLQDSQLENQIKLWFNIH